MEKEAWGAVHHFAVTVPAGAAVVLVPAARWWLLFGSFLTRQGQNHSILCLGFLEVSCSQPSCELSVLLGKAPFDSPSWSVFSSLLRTALIHTMQSTCF